MTPEIERAVAIFTSRETPEVLEATIAATVAAAAGVPTLVDVVVNGNRALAEAMRGRGTPVGQGVTLRTWFIALGDKAHAWNRYIDTIAPSAPQYFFVDGYVRPERASIARIAQALDAHPAAWAASGVPTVGRSAAALREAMRRDVALHGNLYALRGHLVARFRETGFALPLGLYRNDSLLASVVCFGADPATNAWDSTRIVVVPDATWDNDVLSPWSVAGLKTQWKRMQRQAQGELENRAVRQHLARERRAPETLARTTAELIANWRRAAPDEARALLRHPLRRSAAERIALPRDWSGVDLAPERMDG